MTPCEDRPATPRRRVTLLGLRELTLVPVIVLVIIIGAFASDAFLTTDNFLNILQQSSELSVVVIAETLILLAREIRPVAGIGGRARADAGGVADHQGRADRRLRRRAAWWLAIPVVLATGAVVGLINGFLIVKLRLNAFIVTLAMLILLRGVQLGTTNGKTLFDLPDGYLYLGSGKWMGIPVSIWIAGILYLVFGLFLRYHRLGRALYAIGGNADAARVAGIRVERVLWGTLIVGGMLAALAGLMLTGRIASVVTSQGQNMIFYVFAAAVIGGISLNGGKGRLLGALTGVLLLGILQNVLTLAEIPAFWIDAVYGAIILVALVLGRVTGGTAEET